MRNRDFPRGISAHGHPFPLHSNEQLWVTMDARGVGLCIPPSLARRFVGEGDARLFMLKPLRTPTGYEALGGGALLFHCLSFPWCVHCFPWFPIVVRESGGVSCRIRGGVIPLLFRCHSGSALGKGWVERRAGPTVCGVRSGWCKAREEGAKLVLPQCRRTDRPGLPRGMGPPHSRAARWHSCVPLHSWAPLAAFRPG